MRHRSLDIARGYAILFMIVDHVSIFAGLPILRLTVGRLAMPLFFVIAGSLAKRIGYKHVVILAVGIVLPMYVTWIDSPNVLVYICIGTALLRILRGRSTTVHIAVAIACISLTANGYDHLGSGYPAGTLLALMILGKVITSGTLANAFQRIPSSSIVEYMGKHPLALYVGHTVALTTLVGRLQ